MPEGDTIHNAANRLRPLLAGHVPDELLTPHPRVARDRWPERLAGRGVDAVDAHGPDVLAPEFDAERFLRRLREDDPTRPIGDALLDQRTIAGIGNLWKCEACFEARIDPWRPAGGVSDSEALAIVEAVRPRMAQSARDGFQAREREVYGRAGRACPRCREQSRIERRGQWDDNRPTYWCPRCQV